MTGIRVPIHVLLYHSNAHTPRLSTIAYGSYLVARVLIDLQEGLDLGRAVVLGEVHDLVDGDHHLPVVLQVLPAREEAGSVQGRRAVSANKQGRVME
jgi:hypothetical protein